VRLIVSFLIAWWRTFFGRMLAKGTVLQVEKKKIGMEQILKTVRHHVMVSFSELK